MCIYDDIYLQHNNPALAHGHNTSAITLCNRRSLCPILHHREVATSGDITRSLPLSLGQRCPSGRRWTLTRPGRDQTRHPYRACRPEVSGRSALSGEPARTPRSGARLALSARTERGVAGRSGTVTEQGRGVVARGWPEELLEPSGA